MNQPADPLLGTTFAGRYRIERLLGAGGMGCVYTATQLSMNREVALKVLNPDMSASDSAVQRFHREMQATSKVEHACTIRVYDFGRADDGRLFLAMELLDGRTLHAALRERGAFNTARQLRIAEQIARALGAAHSEGIVHRDLKPENIMLLDRYGEHDVVKVLDFGIARFAAGNEPDETPQLTKTGTLIGTPLYMSPEQALGRPVDHRADIYALGVLMYQMATGVPPFTDAQPVRVLFMHAQQEPKPPNEVAGGRLPARLDALIRKMLAKSPDDRPQTTDDVVRALQRVSEGDTRWDGDTGQAPIVSRLADDPEAMARARAGHADPQSLIATVQESITVDDGADALGETVVGVGPISMGDEGLDTAETMAADVLSPLTFQTDDAVGGMETAETIVAGASTLPAGPSAEARAAARVSSPPVHVRPSPPSQVAVVTADDSDGVNVADIDGPTAGAPLASDPQATEEVELPGPKTVVTGQDKDSGGGKSWLLPAIGAVVLLGGIGAWLAMDGAKKDPVGAPDQAAEAVPAVEAEPAKPPAEPPADLAPVREELAALARAAGDPVAPPKCQLKDVAAAQTLAKARKLLVDGRPRGIRPQDAQALALIREVTATHGAAPEVATALAKALLFSGKGSDPTIEGGASEAAKSCPTWGLPHEIVGRVHLLGGRGEAAAKYFERALKHDPAFTRARYNLGIATLTAKDPAGAVAHFDQVLKDDAEHDQATLARGQAQLMLGKHAEAIADLERLTGKQHDHKLGWYLLGGAYAGKNQQEEAEKAWCKAAKLGHKAAAKLCPTP